MEKDQREILIDVYGWLKNDAKKCQSCHLYVSSLLVMCH